MRMVLLLFDSLNRLSLEPYGARQIRTPNFSLLAERSITFDRHYVGSMPCMPARRDIHTGRLSFLHRSWGPLEPFDNSFAEVLGRNRVYSHLISDHYHYWVDGGATYHGRFTTFELVRGQQRDPWKAMVDPPLERMREMFHPLQYSEAWGNQFYHHMINRSFVRYEGDFPSVRCFEHGIEFLDENRKADNWFLQIETFDPHEPFHAPDRYKDPYRTGYQGGILDWPPYRKVHESEEEAAELRANYAAIVAMCDDHLGRVLDYFDEHGMWDDTALIVTTDHGFLLGEHDWWAKNRMPMYEEIAHIPLFVHHPDLQGHAGKRIDALTQTTDMMPTVLGAFGLDVPREVQGGSLTDVIATGEPIRDHSLFGQFGSSVNITDGRYVYYRFPENVDRQELYEYTLMPTHLHAMFSVEELSKATLADPFDWTKGCPLLKVPSTPASPMYDSYGPGILEGTENVLFDLATDPQQLTPVDLPETEAALLKRMSALMTRMDAPAEAFRRFRVDKG